MVDGAPPQDEAMVEPNGLPGRTDTAGKDTPAKAPDLTAGPDLNMPGKLAVQRGRKVEGKDLQFETYQQRGNAPKQSRERGEELYSISASL